MTAIQRKDVPEHLKWNLGSLFKTVEEWQSAFDRVAPYPARLAAYEGRLSESGSVLLEYFLLSEECMQLFGKVYRYARLRSCEDTRDSACSAMVDRCETMSMEIGASVSWAMPELLSIEPELLESFMAETPGLEIYRRDFQLLNRERPHTRSPEVEQLLSRLSKIMGAPSSIFGSLNDADIKLPKVRDQHGRMVQLTNGNWSTLLENPDRGVRRRTYRAMFKTYRALRNTMASIYAARVEVNIACKDARNHASSVEHSLFANEIPVDVYTTLIETVHQNLPKLEAYLKLRKRILGVKELRWYDLYTHLVPEVDDYITYEQAQEITLAALAPLGDDYVRDVAEGFTSRWIDVVESEGKRGGAFSAGTYGTNPFILMNWQNKLRSLFTLDHEIGHSRHSALSQMTQPYTYSGYSIFVAEVASTTNEALLAHYLLSQTTDPKMRLFILNHELEKIKGSLIRQTLFAEFELEAHKAAEAGVPLTADLLGQIYRGLNEKYYGSVVKLDDLIDVEWSRIPHFYNSFFVYQYSTGVAAAQALARQILTEGQPAVDRYLRFLSSGSSASPIDLLRAAGVDMSTAAPVQATFDSFAELLELFAEELAKL